MLASKSYGIPKLTVNLHTKDTHSRSESRWIFVLDKVNELLHDDICLTLAVLNVQKQPVSGQDVGVLVDVLHSHNGHGTQLWGTEFGAFYWKNSTCNLEDNEIVLEEGRGLFFMTHVYIPYLNKPTNIKLISDCDRKVVCPGLSLYLMIVIVNHWDLNFVVEPRTCHPLHPLLLVIFFIICSIIVKHLQQGDILSPIKAEVFNKIEEIRSSVLHWLPNNLINK